MTHENWKTAAVCVLALLAAAAAAPAATHPDAGALERIKSAGALKVGYRSDVPPFSSEGANGVPEGFSIDICRAIAAELAGRLGVEQLPVRYVRVTAANRFDAVASGEVDMVCGATTVTLSRLAQVDFSNLFYVTGASFMSKATVSIENIDDLAGKRIAVVDDTTTIAVLRQRLAEDRVAANLVVVKDHREALGHLEEDRADVAAGDRSTLMGLGFASPMLTSLRLSPLMLSTEPYAFPLPRNDADFRLEVNRALSNIYRRGDVGRMWQRWFSGYAIKPTQLLVNLYQLNTLSE